MGVVVCQDSFEGLGTDNFGSLGRHSLSWWTFPCDFRRRGLPPLAPFGGAGSDRFWILDFGGLFYPSFQNWQTTSFI